MDVKRGNKTVNNRVVVEVLVLAMVVVEVLVLAMVVLDDGMVARET